MGQPEQDRIITAYMQASSRITESVVEYVTSQWLALGSYRDVDAAAFLSRVLPAITAGMTQQGAVTDAYLSLIVSDQLGRDHPVKGTANFKNIRGVSDDEVFHRPFKTMRAGLAEGMTMSEAIDQGYQRLKTITRTHMQLPARRTSRDFLSRTTGVAGYRRVLSGAENCGLCLVASTQRYRKSQLLPIHPGCDCRVAPIAGGDDPGQVIDEQRLAGAHAAIAQRFGDDAADRGARDIDYRKVLLVEEHGEIGPVLTVKSHRFTGPADI
ncbi:MAG: hypothetical protein ACRD0P_05475 [Stackebrandtia sp.]